METEQKQLISDTIDERMDEYVKFAFKDNMMKLAIAFVLGSSFGKVVTSISENLLMPIVKFFTSFAGETWREVKWVPVEGMTLEVGKCVAAFMEFFLTSLVLFVIWKLLIYFRIIGSDPAPMPKSKRRSHT
jgi:large conductance mechanosensitive channel